MTAMDDVQANDVLRAFFADHGRAFSYTKGETIIRAGDDVGGLYLITEGFVKIYSFNDRNEQYLHIVYGAGELFPFAWIVDNSEARAYYAAFTDCKIIRLPREDMESALREDIIFSRALLEKTILQFRMYTNRLENLQYKYARERLIFCLLFLTGRYAERQKDGTYILHLPFTQQLIGDFINLSRESVSREFERLKQLNLIDYAGASLVIKDWETMGKEFKEPIHPEWWGLATDHSAAHSE